MKSRFPRKNVFLTEQPPEYWEEMSYIHALPRDEENYRLDGRAIDRVRALEDVVLRIGTLPEPEEGVPGMFRVEYKGEEYEFHFYYYQRDPAYIREYQKHLFSRAEMEQIGRTGMALTSYMRFGKNLRDSYILQLKLLSALLPDALAFEDESAEKLLNSRWVSMAIGSQLPCDWSALYVVQAISNDENDIWLHTHGLSRCGLPELEILHADVKLLSPLFGVLCTLADMLLEGGGYMEDRDMALIGRLSGDKSLVVRKMSWTKGVLYYPPEVLGTESYRENTHNGHSEIIFALDEDGNPFPPDRLGDLLAENPIFFVADSETERMTRLAAERFGYVRRIAALPESAGYEIALKMGLETKGGVVFPEDHDGDTREHIWFGLLGIDGDRLRLRLQQEPYDIPGLHEGDEGEYSLADMTDWNILTPGGTEVTPGTAYLLDIPEDWI